MQHILLYPCATLVKAPSESLKQIIENVGGRNRYAKSLDRSDPRVFDLENYDVNSFEISGYHKCRGTELSVYYENNKPAVINYSDEEPLEIFGEQRQSKKKLDSENKKNYLENENRNIYPDYENKKINEEFEEDPPGPVRSRFIQMSKEVEANSTSQNYSESKIIDNYLENENKKNYLENETIKTNLNDENKKIKEEFEEDPPSQVPPNGPTVLIKIGNFEHKKLTKTPLKCALEQAKKASKM